MAIQTISAEHILIKNLGLKSITNCSVCDSENHEPLEL